MSTLVLVPGLRGRVEDHWQSHLHREVPGSVVVESFDREQEDLGGRVADLQAAVDAAAGPVVLVAHSAGCLVTLHWAQRHGAGSPVEGVVLATPPALVDELPAAYPSLEVLGAHGWLPVPTGRLPFPSLVGVSADDPLGDPARVRELAATWGSEVVELGAVGHLNPASGFGPWPDATRLLARLDRHTTVC